MCTRDVEVQLRENVSQYTKLQLQQEIQKLTEAGAKLEEELEAELSSDDDRRTQLDADVHSARQSSERGSSRDRRDEAIQEFLNRSREFLDSPTFNDRAIKPHRPVPRVMPQLAAEVNEARNVVAHTEPVNPNIVKRFYPTMTPADMVAAGRMPVLSVMPRSIS